MRVSLIQQQRHKKAMLYRVVYDARGVKIATIALFLFFVVHPMVPVFASEDILVEENIAEEIAEEENLSAGENEQGADEAIEEAEIEEAEEKQTITEEIAEEDEDQAIAEEVAPEEQTVYTESTEVIVTETTATSSVPSFSDTDPTQSTSTENVFENDNGTTTNEHVVDSPTTDDFDSSTATATDEQSGIGTDTTHDVEDTEEVDEETEVQQDDPIDEVKDTTETTTTEEVILELPVDTIEASTTETAVVEVIPLITDANRHQFSVDECVSVGDGSFYCNKTNTIAKTSDAQVVTASIDAEGDHEIYLHTGKKLQQITDNAVDDIAPEYDAVSHTVVWHRLVQGRYQIVTYDIEKEKEEMLTDTRTNNMEPSREGAIIVWQRWIDNNWEIVLFDGEKEHVVTDNATHDIAPDVQGGYVIWHTNNTFGERQVAVYEVATGLISYIEDTDGGQVTNPRFVLMYDTKFENGDLITKGFDPETGGVVALAAQPAEEPIHIPESDSTGETRALIQNKSNTRDDTLEDLVPESNASSTEGTATSSSVLTQEEQNATTTDVFIEAATSTNDVSENLILTDFDIIIEPYEENTTTATDTAATSTES